MVLLHVNEIPDYAHEGFTLTPLGGFSAAAAAEDGAVVMMPAAMRRSRGHARGDGPMPRELSRRGMLEWNHIRTL